MPGTTSSVLIELVRNCVNRAKESDSPEPVLEGLDALSRAYAASGDTNVEDYVANKGLETASRGVIKHRQLGSADCIAIDLRAAGIDDLKAKQLIEKLNQKGEPAVIDNKVYLTDNERYIGISPKSPI